MFKWIATAPVRPAGYAIAVALIGAIAVVAATSNAFAQQKKKDAPKEQQKQPPQQQQSEAPQLNFSPWTKFCLKGQEANAKQVCFTGKDGRVDSGQPVVAAVLIEPDGEPRKILRITLPLGMSLQPGTRAIIDQGQPMTAPYAICFNNGCMADYEATQALIDTMKKGQSLVVQGINGAGQAISLVLPLDDFAKAYNGPPTDPAELEKRNKQLQDEMQRRAEEARKKLEGQKK
jgi:invasion protein IalB